MMCAKLLRPIHESRHGRLYQWSERVFKSMIETYDRGLKWVLRHQRTTLLVTIGTLCLTLILFYVVPKGFFPQQDTGLLQGVSEAAPDVSFQKMMERQRALSEVVMADPDVSSVASFIGADGVITTTNSGRMSIALKTREQRDTAARLGVLPQAIDDVLYDAFGQRQISTIFTQLNQYRVILEVKPEFQQSPEALKHIYVRSTSGEAVPLSAFVSLETTTAPLSISHQGQFPAVTLSFNLAPNVALGDAVSSIRRAEQEIGMPASIRPNFQGTAQAFQSSLATEPFLILAALITVYIVLGVLYESYIHPVTILSTLPSAGVGAVLALMFSRTEFSVIALIGVILLIGIVKKNAIMMITMAALLGGIPLALGSGTGSELRRPLGISIVGGLLISQVLTLYTTPVIYLYMDRASRWFARWRTRVSVQPKPVAEGEAM